MVTLQNGIIGVIANLVSLLKCYLSKSIKIGFVGCLGWC